MGCRGYLRRGNVKPSWLSIIAAGALLVPVAKILPRRQQAQHDSAAVAVLPPAAVMTAGGKVSFRKAAAAAAAAEALAAAVVPRHTGESEIQRIRAKTVEETSGNSLGATAQAAYTPGTVYCSGYCGIGDGLGDAHYHTLSALLFDRPVVTCYTNESRPTETDILLVGMHGTPDGCISSGVDFPNYELRRVNHVGAVWVSPPNTKFQALTPGPVKAFPGKVLILNGEPKGSLSKWVMQQGFPQESDMYQQMNVLRHKPIELAALRDIAVRDGVDQERHRDVMNSNDGLIELLQQRATRIPNNLFYIGPVQEETKHELLSLHLATTAVPMFLRDHGLAALLASKRAESNDGVHFLAYANRNCHKQRVDSVGKLHKITDGGLSPREEAFTKICQARSVAKLEMPTALGACSGRGPHTAHVTKMKTDRNWTANQQLFSHYRFVLCFENVDVPFYITEKIFVAFQSGAIPIYWGTQDVFKVFNREAFIFWDPDHPELALERLAYLEANPDAYKEMQARPYLAHGAETVREYFSYSSDVGEGWMQKRIISMLSGTE